MWVQMGELVPKKPQGHVSPLLLQKTDVIVVFNRLLRLILAPCSLMTMQTVQIGEVYTSISILYQLEISKIGNHSLAVQLDNRLLKRARVVHICDAPLWKVLHLSREESSKVSILISSSTDEISRTSINWQ